MGTPEEGKPKKLSKPEKQAKKTLETATERIEKHIEQNHHTKSCISALVFIDALIFIGVLFLTTSPFGIILVYGYVTFITLVALVPFMINEYEQVGRTPPALVRWFNSFLKKLLPMDRKKVRMGPAILISFIFLVTLGGFLAIGIYTFADFLSNNDLIYSYLVDTGNIGDYGFFSFIANSSANSLVPTILWWLIIAIPVVFCFLFLIAAVFYRNHNSSKILSVIIIAPIVVLLPLFLSASAVDSPSIIIAILFLGAWGLTLLIWYRQPTKRNVMILGAILFTQVLASVFVIYGFLFHQKAYYPTDVSSYYNPLVLSIWFGVLVFIPLIVKGFDISSKGAIKIMGVIIAVTTAVLFQYYFFPLFSQSVYAAWPAQQQLAEIFVGFGFFYFYIALLLIPLFFIFGYFQIGFVRWIYRAVRDYGYRIKRTGLFSFLGGILASFTIIGLVIVYYVFLYTAEDYQNMFSQAAQLFNGDFITKLTDITVPPGTLDVKEIFEVTSLAITMLLLAYSSYRGAYNLSLFADQVEDPQKNIRRLGVFNFVVFTSPRSYKTRVIFGISLIFVFLGITTIFAFLKIHSVLFTAEFSPLTNPSLILFNMIDGLKLGISIFGMFIAIAIFFSFLRRSRKTKARF